MAKDNLNELLAKIDAVTQKAIASGDQQTLDNISNFFETLNAYEQSSELLDNIVSEVEEVRETAEEAEAMVNWVEKESSNPDFQPYNVLSDENRQKLADAINASQAAQHPLHYAMGEVAEVFKGAAACLSGLKEIPEKMRSNVSVAQAAGYESRTALVQAAEAIASGAKGLIVSNAMRAASSAQNIFSSATDTLYGLWNKAKEGASKAMLGIGKSVDMGLELVSLGGWSRLCDRMCKDGQLVGKDTNSTIERMSELGYDKSTVNLFKSIYEGEKKLGVENINEKLSKAAFAIHCKLTGDSVDNAIHQEYWSDVKSVVWGKNKNAKEDVFGCTSPMDFIADAIEQVDQKVAKVDRDVNQFMNEKVAPKIDEAGKFVETKAIEISKAVEKTVQELPGTLRSATNKTITSMRDGLKEAGNAILTTGTSLVAASLYKFAKLFDKIELANKNAQARASMEISANLSKMNSAYEKSQDMSAELYALKNNKVEAKFDNSEIVAARGHLVLANQTSAVVKALNALDKAEEQGMRKAKRDANFTNMVNSLKSSPVVLLDTAKLKVAESQIDKAQQDWSKSSEKFSKAESRAGRVHDTAEKIREVADKIKGKGDNGGGGREEENAERDDR